MRGTTARLARGSRPVDPPSNLYRLYVPWMLNKSPGAVTVTT